MTGILVFRAADSAFHHAIAAAARSPRLEAAIDEARGLLFLPTDALVYALDIDQCTAITPGSPTRCAQATRVSRPRRCGITSSPPGPGCGGS